MCLLQQPHRAYHLTRGTAGSGQELSQPTSLEPSTALRGGALTLLHSGLEETSGPESVKSPTCPPSLRPLTVAPSRPSAHMVHHVAMAWPFFAGG